VQDKDEAVIRQLASNLWITNQTTASITLELTIAWNAM